MMTKALPYVLFISGLLLGAFGGYFKGKNEILEGRLLPEVSFAVQAVMEEIKEEKN